MNKEDILTTGSLYWYKAGRRGSVEIPIELLDDKQKEILRSGLETDRYQLYMPHETINAHYVWINDIGLYEKRVTDIEILQKIKNKLKSPRKVNEKYEYTFTLSDMKRLYNDFKKGVVDREYVEYILTKQPRRYDQYAEWKSMRAKRIGNACDNCGKTSNLVMQHTTHPKKLNIILYELVGENREEYEAYKDQNRDKIKLPLPENTRKVPVCPKCGSSRIRHRQKKNNYVCEKTRNKVICKHEFIIPDYGYDEKDIDYAEKKRNSMLKDMYCQKHNLYSKAIEISLEEIIIYLSLKHTKTLCKGCAFKEDRHLI